MTARQLADVHLLLGVDNLLGQRCLHLLWRLLLVRGLSSYSLSVVCLRCSNTGFTGATCSSCAAGYYGESFRFARLLCA